MPNDARSVHLNYPDLSGSFSSFFIDVTVNESHPGSFFCGMTCHTPGLYFGLQETYQGVPAPPGIEKTGYKLLIFSLWDRDGNSAKVIKTGNNVWTAPFEGEGTGAKTMLAYDWKVNQSYRFKIESTKPDEFSCSFLDPAKNDWFFIATLNRPNSGNLVAQPDSFVEDFKRDGQSAKVRRAAAFSNIYAFDVKRKGEFVLSALSSAYTDPKDPTPPLMNMNATVVQRGFLLETGGAVVNTQKLNTYLPSQIAPLKIEGPFSIVNYSSKRLFVASVPNQGPHRNLSTLLHLEKGTYKKADEVDCWHIERADGNNSRLRNCYYSSYICAQDLDKNVIMNSSPLSPETVWGREQGVANEFASSGGTIYEPRAGTNIMLGKKQGGDLHHDWLILPM